MLVEGAGGLLVRFDDTGGTLADVAARLGAPVLVVAQAGLGTLNHTALTVEALRSRALTCVGVVIGAWPAEPDLAARCNLADLPAVTGAPLLGALPAGSGGSNPAEFAAVAASRARPRARRRMADSRAVTTTEAAILSTARQQVLERGVGLDEAQVLEVLRLPDDRPRPAAGAGPRGADALVRAGGRGRGDHLAEDRRLPRGLPLLLPVRAVRLPGPRGLAGRPVAGRGGQADREDRAPPSSASWPPCAARTSG